MNTEIYLVGIFAGSLLFPAGIGTVAWLANRNVANLDREIKGLKEADAELRLRDEKLGLAILEAREAATARDFMHDLILERLSLAIKGLASAVERLERKNERD